MVLLLLPPCGLVGFVAAANDARCAGGGAVVDMLTVKIDAIKKTKKKKCSDFRTTAS